jgi:hypothetical protein
MKPKSNEQQTEETLGFLAQMDTAGPEDEEEGEDEDEDTGAPVNLSGLRALLPAGTPEKIRREIDALERSNGGRPITAPQAQAVVLKHTAAAVRKAPRPRINLNFGGRPAPRPDTVAWRNNFFAEFRKEYPDAVESPAFYYSEAEAVFTGETTTAAVTSGLYIDPTVGGTVADPSPASFSCFNYAIGDTIKRMGNDVIANPSHTNLQNPGKGLYPNEATIIEQVNVELCGMRIAYNAAAINALTTTTDLTALQKRALTGLLNVDDDAGIAMPVDIYNEYADVNKVLRELNKSGVLVFDWNKKKGGGSKSSDQVIVKPLQDIQIGRVGVHPSSAGASLLAAEPGYLWTQNQNKQGRYGIFTASLNFYDPIYFFLKSIKIPNGTGALFAPEKLGLYFRVTLYGTTIRPASDQVDLGPNGK